MECSEELGDMVKAADPTLALSGRKKVLSDEPWMSRLIFVSN